MNSCSKIWSRNRVRWMVASGLASGDSVGSTPVASASGARRNALACMVLVIGLSAGASAADAVCVDPSTGLPMGTASGAGNEVACGDGAVASASNAIAVGYNAIASGTNALATGAEAAASGLSSVAVGNTATASNTNAIAVGVKANASGRDSLALGPNSVASGSLSTDGNPANGFALAIGSKANAAGSSSTAIGGNSLSSGTKALALGDTALSSATRSIAIGANANATMDRALAIGNRAAASAQADDVALGAGSTTTTVSATTGVMINGTGYAFTGTAPASTLSIGAVGAERTLTNLAAGRISATSTDAINGSQLFATHQAIEELNVVVDANKIRYYSVNSTDGGNQENDGATGADAIAAGKDATAEGDEAVALGYGATASGDGALAFGSGAQALSLNSLAIGAGAVASHGNSVALGAGSATMVGAQTGYQGAFVGTSSSSGEVNVGGRQITGVAAGNASADAVNVSQLQGGVNHAVTESNAYTDTQISNVSTAIAHLDNRVSAIEDDIVDIRGDITDIQSDVTHLDNRVTTVEGDVTVLTTTVNQFDNRIGNIEDDVTNIQNGSDGMFQVSPEATIVKPMPSGTNSSAGGNGAVASGTNALAVGNQSTASGANSTAIGQGATASHDNSVALGRGSATTVGAQTNYNAAYVGSSTSSGEVNVGSRTVTGVAAGIAGTDAVNVNQLNAGVDYAIGEANSYTDRVINSFLGDAWIRIDDVERNANAGIATAISLKSAPYVAGKTTYYAGFGAYKDQGAVGISLRRTADNGRWSLEGGFSANRDSKGVYVGISGVIGSD